MQLSTRIYKRLELGDGVWVEARCLSGLEVFEMMTIKELSRRFEFVLTQSVRSFGGIEGDDGKELSGDGAVFGEHAPLPFVDEAVALITKMSNIEVGAKKK